MRSIPAAEQLEAAAACKFRNAGGCAIAGAILRTGPITCPPSSCVACQRSAAPQRINVTTLALAKAAATTPREQDAVASLEQKLQVLIQRAAGNATTAAAATTACATGQGPGSELWRMLEAVGITHRQPEDIDPTGCGCADYCLQMNGWGPVGCRERLDEIVGHLRAEAEQRRSDKRQTIRQRALAWCFTNWGARKLVEMAISRSETFP